MFAHGSFSSASCVSCGLSRDLDLVRQELLGDLDPRCDACGGLVKPDLVFFGGALPERFGMCYEDAAKADYLICMGTSLEVAYIRSKQYCRQFNYRAGL